MITFLILTLTAVVFVLGQYSLQEDLSSLAVKLFAVYTFCCFVDLVFGFLSLRRTVGRRNVRTGVLHPLSWVGRCFSGYQEAISYRLSSLTSQIEENVDEPELEIPAPTLNSEQSFFEQTLSELEFSFKANSAAVIIQDNVKGPVRILIKGQKGKRLEESLRGIFLSYFNDGNTQCLGSLDTLHHDFPTGQLSGLGIRYLVSTAFERQEKKGLLYLGFASDREPAISVQNRLADFTKRLERELSTLNRFQELRSQVDKAEKVSEARTEFLTHISHDIKSPLNNVKAILNLLEFDEAEESEGKKLVEAAHRNCDSVAELVESLIDFAKHRAGKLTANKSVFNLSQLVDELMQEFEAVAKVKGLSLNFVSPVTAVPCFADRTQIRRVISNLLSNSIKYTQFGKISLSISNQGLNNWLMRISDSGQGFSEQELKEIFTPFTRFASTDSEGAGLGLSVCKILSEINGGSLELCSEIGVGSVFGLSLPSAIKEKQTPLDSSNPVELSLVSSQVVKNKVGDRLQGLRLLVVDDDIDATQTLARILAKEGAEVAQAVTVPDALSIINFDQQDVVISDAIMPEGGGKRLIKYIKLNHPEIAVLVVSGDPKVAEELVALGAACVMDKPLHISELIDYLEDVLRCRNEMAVGS